MDQITVTIAPERDCVRMFARTDQRDVLKAVLGPASTTHPRAAATMLEGLALWHQRPLSVVLCADDEEHGSALALCDALGFGQRTLHYEVGIALHRGRRRRRDRRGLGDFRDLRQLGIPGVLR